MKKSALFFIFCVAHVIVFAQKKPNMVIIISDDHAYQAIGAYGSQFAHTPNIDKIASTGVRMDRAYVTNSICSPSRATLLTGKYSHKNGFKDNETSNFDHSQDLFVKDLQKVGYKTAWIGKQHLGNEPQGFDYFSVLVGQGTYFNPTFINKGNQREAVEGYVSDIVTDKATRWLDSLDKNNPFCLIIGHKATHRTWMPDPQDFGKNDHKKFQLPANFYDHYEDRLSAAGQEMSIDKDMQMAYDLKMYESTEKMKTERSFARMNEKQLTSYMAYYKPIKEQLDMQKLSGKALAEWKYRRYMIDYLNTAESMDRNIGRVLDYLKEHNLEKNTLVMYVSDQGFYMGEHGWFDKRFMYEESFRTPMVIQFPELIAKGTISNAKIMNVDIAPTLLELAGVKKPAEMQGESFVKVLKGQDKEGRENLYYHYYENGEHAVSPHFGVSDGRYKLIRFYKRVNAWELYDLSEDPSEMKNIYGSASSKTINTLKKKLKKEIQKVDDKEALTIFNQKL
ncbi:sulfatase [Sphingobacterium sp. SRCM116780]|uniref:sulfatase family protein n=1 Tax=Sphingobacterium sp. SRCM116780 TaxID=2907623 RepID=UPI001F4179ED|nr:sulfatase [Sphingobacterium sp. SRCM116780]UIR55542.1 sulfatase [Sphingobacterium sp. SRCM116780]